MRQNYVAPIKVLINYIINAINILTSFSFFARQLLIMRELLCPYQLYLECVSDGCLKGIVTAIWFSHFGAFQSIQLPTHHKIELTQQKL